MKKKTVSPDKIEIIPPKLKNRTPEQIARRGLGRPLKFQSVEILQSKIEKYFIDMEDSDRPLTITGLAVALDTSRETLLDYADRQEFSDTIKQAKNIIHNYAEEYLYTGKNQAGAIFNLKNNYGWKDSQEITQVDEIQVKFEDMSDEELDKAIELRATNVKLIDD